MAKQTGSVDLKAVAQAGATAEETTQYFWFNSTDSGAGEGAGAHITETDKATFIADPTNGGGNVLIDSDSVDVRDGTNVLATFGANGARVGQIANGKSRTVIGTDGMQIIQRDSGSDVPIAHLGYGEARGGSSQVTQSPYYTFGTRIGSYNGGYSVTEGKDCEAGAYCSHAEGRESEAGWYYAHAGGFRGRANGIASFVHGSGVDSETRAQVVFGEYNDIEYGIGDTRGTYVLIIGNGEADSVRSNAFMVDWNGDIYPQATKMADFIVEQGTDNNWVYRKWNSGRYEAWLRYNATGMALTSASSNTYYNATSGVKNVTLPSFNIGTDYYVTGQEQPSMSSSVYIYSIQTYSATQMQVSYRAHASTASAQCNGMFYLMGKWKW